MSEVPNITGKIAAVIDASTLVLNIGSEHGVREGMLFAIVASQGEITDPDTGQSLGQWEQVKARVVVTHVQERMSTARPPVLPQEHVSGTLSEMMVRHHFGLYGDRDESDDRPQLNVAAGSMTGRSRLAPIAVGDGVRSMALEPIPVEAVRSAGATDLPSQAYGSGGSDSGTKTDAEPAGS